MATIGTIAIGTDTDSDRISVRTAVEADSPGSRFPSEHETSIYLSHSATLLDFIIANSSSRRAATPCDSRQRPTSTHTNRQPQRTCFCPRIATPPFLVTNPCLPTARQLQPVPPITGNQPPERPDRTDSTRFTARLRPPQQTCFNSCIYTPSLLTTRSSLPTARQLQPAPPVTCNRSPARPHRTASSSLPASLRPAVPPACRPNCPGRLAWTRPPLSRSAQRLHASEPGHPVPGGTPCTFQKYDRKKNEKKMPNNSCNIFSQLWVTCPNAFVDQPSATERTSPAYAPATNSDYTHHHSHHPWRAGMNSQVSGGGSFAKARHAPSSISELGSGTLSAVTVYAFDLGSAALGRISSDSLPAERQVCLQPSKLALHYAPSSISELGSGTLSAVTVYAFDLGSAALGRISSDSLPAERQVCLQPSKLALHYAPSSISEPGSGTLSAVTMYAPNRTLLARHIEALETAPLGDLSPVDQQSRAPDPTVPHA